MIWYLVPSPLIKIDRMHVSHVRCIGKSVLEETVSRHRAHSERIPSSGWKDIYNLSERWVKNSVTVMDHRRCLRWLYLR